MLTFSDFPELNYFTVSVNTHNNSTTIRLNIQDPLNYEEKVELISKILASYCFSVRKEKTSNSSYFDNDLVTITLNHFVANSDEIFDILTIIRSVANGDIVTLGKYVNTFIFKLTQEA